MKDKNCSGQHLQSIKVMQPRQNELVKLFTPDVQEVILDKKSKEINVNQDFGNAVDLTKQIGLEYETHSFNDIKQKEQILQDPYFNFVLRFGTNCVHPLSVNDIEKLINPENPKFAEEECELMLLQLNCMMDICLKVLPGLIESKTNYIVEFYNYNKKSYGQSEKTLFKFKTKIGMNKEPEFSNESDSQIACFQHFIQLIEELNNIMYNNIKLDSKELKLNNFRRPNRNVRFFPEHGLYNFGAMNELDYCSQSIEQYKLPSGFEIMEKIDFELLPQYISLLAETIKDIDTKIKNSNQNPN